MGEAHFSDFNQPNTSRSIVSMNRFQGRNRSVISAIIEPKLCILCKQQFDSNDYADHVAQCTPEENDYSPPNFPSIQQDLIHTESINDLPSNSRPYTNDDDADEDSDMKFVTPRDSNSPIMVRLFRDLLSNHYLFIIH
jgi:hypothetical protein